jgi:carboxypeptidase PM20D1
MTPVLNTAFSELAPRIIEEPLCSLAANPAAHEQELTDCCMERSGRYNFISTTIAPTMIEGGSQAGNVMPQDMRAVINFRIAPHNTVDEVIARCRSLVDDKIELSVVQGNEASAIARMDGYGYPALLRVLRRFFGDVVFLPSISTGATDAHQYEGICDTCLRFSPFLEQSDIVMTGVHGTNERISVRSYLHGIRVLIALMQETCVNP